MFVFFNLRKSFSNVKYHIESNGTKIEGLLVMFNLGLRLGLGLWLGSWLGLGLRLGLGLGLGLVLGLGLGLGLAFGTLPWGRVR